MDVRTPQFVIMDVVEPLESYFVWTDRTTLHDQRATHDSSSRQWEFSVRQHCVSIALRQTCPHVLASLEAPTKRRQGIRGFL